MSEVITWKTVEGHEGYEVSNQGQVRNIKRNTILKQNINNNGYSVVSLNGKTKQVHRLVAEAFIPNPDSLPFIDHIDTVRTNNCVDNLRWVSPSGNNSNELTMEHIKEATKHRTVNKARQVRCVETGVVYESTMDVQRKLGIRCSHVTECINGGSRRKTAGKYHWELVEIEEDSNEEVAETPSYSTANSEAKKLSNKRYREKHAAEIKEYKKDLYQAQLLGITVQEYRKQKQIA